MLTIRRGRSHARTIGWVGNPGECGGRRRSVLRAAKEEAVVVYAMFLFLLAAQLKRAFCQRLVLFSLSSVWPFPFPVHSVTLWVDTSIGIEE
jgi:hypothetical protein